MSSSSTQKTILLGQLCRLRTLDFKETPRPLIVQEVLEFARQSLQFSSPQSHGGSIGNTIHQPRPSPKQANQVLCPTTSVVNPRGELSEHGRVSSLVTIMGIVEALDPKRVKQCSL